ncbi:MAG: RusA-like resolvase [Phage AS32]|nr:MAG: RusA-like resolvase [Phage AS32]
MSRSIWYKLWVNPEPWAIGSISRGKSGAQMSPNLNLVAFQSAVREELSQVKKLPEDYRKLEFFFFRQQARYLDMSDKIRQRNQADATNMGKALEDALQGILFDNDREVRDIRSVIVSQSINTEPCILIKASPFRLNDAMAEIPTALLEEALMGQKVHEKEVDRWEDSEVDF